MSVKSIASRLIELCTKGNFIEAQQELYDDAIVSIESDGSQTIGRLKMHAKEEQFLSRLNKIVSVHYDTPQFAGSYFTVVLTMEIDIKEVGVRKIEEVCVYKVSGNKIVFEQFFRDMP